MTTGDNHMLTVPDYAVAHGKSIRSVHRWLAAGRLPDARMVDRQWLIPANAIPDLEAPVAGPLRKADRDREITVTSSAPVFWFTVEDLVREWRPLFTPYGIMRMIKDGHLTAYPHGPNGQWVVPASELRRILGTSS